MSPKAKNVNVSSNKSMDITTTEKDKMPEVKVKKPEIVKPSGMIKDVSPSQSTDEDNLDNPSKIEMSQKLVSNLKSPSESHVKIIPSEPAPEDTKNDEPDADDLTNDDEHESNSKFIDNISEDTDEKEDDGAKDTEEVEKPRTSDKLGEKTEPTVSKAEHPDKKPVENDTKKEQNKEEEEAKEDEGGIVNEMAEQAADSKKQKQEEKELEVRSKHVEELIEAKTYNVPIGQLSRKRNIRLVIALLLLLIVGGFVALNFAVDAGMVDIGVEPLTDVIAN